MALNDIIKAKKLVEDWKRSIRDIDQGLPSSLAYYLLKSLKAIYKEYEMNISERLMLLNWESRFQDFRARIF